MPIVKDSSEYHGGSEFDLFKMKFKSKVIHNSYSKVNK